MQPGPAAFSTRLQQPAPAQPPAQPPSGRTRLGLLRSRWMMGGECWCRYSMPLAASRACKQGAPWAGAGPGRGKSGHVYAQGSWWQALRGRTAPRPGSSVASSRQGRAGQVLRRTWTAGCPEACSSPEAEQGGQGRGAARGRAPKAVLTPPTMLSRLVQSSCLACLALSLLPRSTSAGRGRGGVPARRRPQQRAAAKLPDTACGRADMGELTACAWCSWCGSPLLHIAVAQA